MIKTFRLCISFCTILLLLPSITLVAQNLSQKKSVNVHVVSHSDSTVHFSWKNFSIQYTEISRKHLDSVNWSVIASGLTDTNYVDSTVQPNVEYEYQFKVSTGSTPADAYGYATFGVNIDAKTSRGNMLLVVDDRFVTSLQNQLIILQQDLISDGWNPILYYVSKDTTPQYVKVKIDSIAGATTVDAVYLVGHIPVPYSGAISPDGHGDHFGAWPTDLYYVTTASLWTDIYYNFTNSTRPVNSNYFNDGVYDNGILPSAVNCPISRIDFYNMPLLANSELDLLRNYLNKASDYKHVRFNTLDTAIIENRIQNYGEGFVVSAEMTFSSLVDKCLNVNSSISDLTNKNYKWYMASSFGGDTVMYNIGNVPRLDTTDYQGVFSLVFGSYFGDWNTPNNYMRAILANGKMLTSCWAGRPSWFYHHMGLNRPIAFSAKQTFNNGRRGLFSSTSYENAGNSSNGVHLALLGDLSLRNEYLRPVNSLNAVVQSNGVKTYWDYQGDTTGVEFHIYSSQDSLSNFELKQILSASDSIYVDDSGTIATHYYIQTVKLSSVQAGSYYNNSVGVFASHGVPGGVVPVELVELQAELKGDDVLVRWETASELNNEGFQVQRRMHGDSEFKSLGFVTGHGTKASMSEYAFYDHTNSWLQNKAYYRLKQIDFDGRFEYSRTVVVYNQKVGEVFIYPNPAGESDIVTVKYDKMYPVSEVKIFSTLGVEVDANTKLFKETSQLEISNLKKGTYFISLRINKQNLVRKLIVN